MTDKKDEAMKLALEALERVNNTTLALKAMVPECREFAAIAQDLDWVIHAIREALAQSRSDKEQPAQQPITGLDVYLDPSDGLKPKLYSPQPAQQQEPVAKVEETWASENGYEIPGMTERYAEFFNEPPPKGTLLYTSTPASKPWVGLTDEEIRKAFYDSDDGQETQEYILTFAKAIEAKLRKKNK